MFAHIHPKSFSWVCKFAHLVDFKCTTKLTTLRINQRLQLSSGHVCPHPSWCTIFLSINFAHLVILPPPNWPLSESRISSEEMFAHIHPESFGWFCTIFLFIFFGSLGNFSAPPNLTSPKINQRPQVSSEYVYPHPFRGFLAVVHHLPFHQLCSLGNFDPKYAPPNWPSSESTMDSNFPQGMMPHTHSEGFDRFCMGKLSIDFVHLVILAPNMHDQDDILQNQQWTPTSFRVCSPTSNPRVLAGFAWVSFPSTLFTWWF